MQPQTLPNLNRTLLAIIFFLFVSSAVSANISRVNVFNWVKMQAINPADTIPSDQISDGVFYMLIERQVNLFTNQIYYHYAYKVISEQGVQNNSEISINYKPAYQKFYLHNIKIIRNGKVLSKGNTSHIKELQQEKELDYYIYDETKTVYAILKDIRPGDIIEYDYTIEGFNPIFNGKVYLKFWTNLSYTLPHFYYRLIKPAGEIKYKYYNNPPLPNVIRKGDQEEWIWDCHDNKPIESEDYAPAWFTNYPWVEISSFLTWKEVEQWGLEVFSVNEKLDKAIIRELDRIKLKYEKTPDRIVAILRFVQKQIRYMGVEVGENSHKPKSPNQVFSQRYGDCKDKSLLLCKMLSEIGVEAYPALVNTWMSEDILKSVPSAMAFDHCVVKALVDDYEYWFDPTISTQQGNLSNTQFPGYGYALVLDGKFHGLDPISNISISKITIDEQIEVKDLKGEALLKIHTTYQGKKADDIRNDYSQSSLKEIQKRYLDFYKRNYDSVAVKLMIYFEDDTVKNIFTTHEFYHIKDFWKKGKDGLKSSIFSYQVTEKLEIYKDLDSRRNAPLDLEYPLNIHHMYKVIFPEDWYLNAFNESISNEYFYFNTNGSCNGNVCLVEYSFQTYKDFVPAKDVSMCLNAFKTIEDEHNGMVFTYNPSVASNGSFKMGWGLFLLFLFFLGFIFYGSMVLFFKKKNFQTESLILQQPRIGGWMVLPILGLFLTPVITIYHLINGNLFDAATFELYTTDASTSHHFLWAFYWILSLFFQAFFITIPALLLILVFRFDKRAPQMIIIYFITKAIVFLLFAILSSLIPDFDPSIKQSEITNFGRAFIYGAIWIPYFYYSSRVRETFVR